MEVKPLQKARKLPLMQEIRGVSMTRFADQVMVADADVSSEGTVEVDAKGEAGSYHGTTLVSIALDRCDLGPVSSGAAAAAVLEAARRSLSLHVRLMRLARIEAESRSAPLLLRGMQVGFEFKIEGALLLVDIIVECPLAASSHGVDDVEEEA